MPEPTLPTQQFVAVKEIKSGIVYLKKGELRKILIVSGVNFDLKSEEEQNLILNTFQTFLNTLDFPVQFFIHSRKINIEEYLEKMKVRKDEEKNELLKIQIEEYINFIRSFVEENAIISKSFFVIVPYDPIVVTGDGGGLSNILNIFNSSKSKPAEVSARAEEHLEQLDRRVSQVTEGLEQIGLRVAALNNEELTELFFNLYNPRFMETKDLRITHTPNS